MQAMLMKAVVCTKYGPPEVLQLQDVAKPAPKDDVIVRRTHVRVSSRRSDGVL
jgi:NADPH:quinone reductase-like Zn-dependent oxidoreductase